MSEITWHNERRKVSALITWAINPRKISEQQQEHLKRSLQRFNLADPIIIDTDDTVVGGHQRLTVLNILGRQDEEIDVRVPNRKLTDEEFRELALRLNRNGGDWDWSMLEEYFEVGDLLDFGFEAHEFGLHNQELENIEVPDDSDREKVEFLASPRQDKGDMVIFECYMSKANREKLITAIKRAKSEHHLDTTEDAIMSIVNDYGSFNA